MDKEMTDKLEVTFEYSAIWYLEKAECEELTDEEDRNIATFFGLKETVQDIPLDLLQRTAELARRYPGVFELSLATFVSNVNDIFRPKTAAEFVEKLTAHVQFAFDQTDLSLPMMLGKHTIGVLRFSEQGELSVEFREGIAAG